MACHMEEVNCFILMAAIMSDTLKMVYLMEKEDSSALMDGIMKVSWKINRPREGENLYFKKMVCNIREIGLLIFLMVLEKKPGSEAMGP
mgnify:CR=1 FL=1